MSIWEAKELNEGVQWILLLGHLHKWRLVPLRHQDAESILKSHLKPTHFFLPCLPPYTELHHFHSFHRNCVCFCFQLPIPSPGRTHGAFSKHISDQSKINPRAQHPCLKPSAVSPLPLQQIQPSHPVREPFHLAPASHSNLISYYPSSHTYLDSSTVTFFLTFHCIKLLPLSSASAVPYPWNEFPPFHRTDSSHLSRFNVKCYIFREASLITQSQAKMLIPAYRILFTKLISSMRLHSWLSGKEAICQCRRLGFNSWVEKDPLEKEMATHSISLPENLMDRGAWLAAVHRSHKESDTT